MTLLQVYFWKCCHAKSSHFERDKILENATVHFRIRSNRHTKTVWLINPLDLLNFGGAKIFLGIFLYRSYSLCTELKFIWDNNRMFIQNISKFKLSRNTRPMCTKLKYFPAKYQCRQLISKYSRFHAQTTELI